MRNERKSRHASLVTRYFRPAVFLDRDGVLNRDSEDFIRSADELELLPGAVESVARLNAAGYLCVVITNQSGIARGLFVRLSICRRASIRTQHLRRPRLYSGWAIRRGIV